MKLLTISMAMLLMCAGSSAFANETKTIEVTTFLVHCDTIFAKVDDYFTFKAEIADEENEQVTIHKIENRALPGEIEIELITTGTDVLVIKGQYRENGKAVKENGLRMSPIPAKDSMGSNWNFCLPSSDKSPFLTFHYEIL